MCRRCGGTRVERGANYLVLSIVPCARCRPFAHLKHAVRLEWWARTRFMDRVDWLLITALVLIAGVGAWRIFG